MERDVEEEKVKSPQEIYKDRHGYLKESDNIEAMVEQYGDFRVAVKDVNGQRAVMNASDFTRLQQNRAFTDRIRDVFIPVPEEGQPIGMPIDKPIFPEDFMEEIQVGKLLEAPKQAKQTGELVDIEGIKLTNNSTVSPRKRQQFVEMITDNNVRSILKEHDIKEVIIEPPYKFSLSEQAHINKKTRVISINADAINPTDTILHELGHQKFEGLPKNIQDKLINQVKTSQNPLVAGYLKTGNFKEAVAELIYKDKKFFAVLISLKHLCCR